MPLKQITLLKLELVATVTAVKLARFAIDSLRLKATVYMWSNSVVLEMSCSYMMKDHD